LDNANKFAEDQKKELAAKNAEISDYREQIENSRIDRENLVEMTLKLGLENTLLDVQTDFFQTKCNAQEANVARIITGQKKKEDAKKRREKIHDLASKLDMFPYITVRINETTGDVVRTDIGNYVGGIVDTIPELVAEADLVPELDLTNAEKNKDKILTAYGTNSEEFDKLFSNPGNFNLLGKNMNKMLNSGIKLNKNKVLAFLDHGLKLKANGGAIVSKDDSGIIRISGRKDNVYKWTGLKSTGMKK
jgi:hypothetical protein